MADCNIQAGLFRFPEPNRRLFLLSIAFIIIGAVFLVKGADLLVDGGAGMALKSGVSPLVVGLTVVAFGTSAPELTASLIAAFKGAGDICFGNVVGSNVANIALILGVTAMIRPVAVNPRLVRWELPFLVGISAFTMYIGYAGSANIAIGIALLLLFAVYLVHCMKSPPAPLEVDDDASHKSSAILITMIAIGIVGLGLGGWLFVEGAREIARTLGVSEAVIGLTVVAFGTSLPELVTSGIAAVKGHSDISLGNIVGSNIFNILLVLGATSVIRPFAISPDRYLMLVGLPLMMGLALMLLPMALTGKKISRKEGGVIFMVYIAYCAAAVVMS